MLNKKRSGVNKKQAFSEFLQNSLQIVLKCISAQKAMDTWTHRPNIQASMQENSSTDPEQRTMGVFADTELEKKVFVGHNFLSLAFLNL